MTGISSILFFALWLFGAFGTYNIGWIYHAFLVAAIMLAFITAVRARKIETSEVMERNEMPKAEADKVINIMDKNKLSEQEAIELMGVRAKDHPMVKGIFIQTEPDQIRKVMKANKLCVREATELLNIRFKFHRR